jgi:hypothetical protein
MRKEAMQRFKQVFSRKRMVIGTLALATFATRPALALQPLPEFVVSSQKHNFDTREARAVKDQREADAVGARCLHLQPVRSCCARQDHHPTASAGRVH